MDDSLDTSRVSAHVTVAVRVKTLTNSRPGTKDDLHVFPNPVAPAKSLIVKGAITQAGARGPASARRNSLSEQTFTFDYVHWSAGDTIK